MQKGTINVKTENIFPIIKKFLYSDHEIFLRELISNAVDSTQKLKALASLMIAEIAKPVKYGDLSREEALRMLTLYPARMMYIDNKFVSVLLRLAQFKVASLTEQYEHTEKTVQRLRKEI